MTLITLTAGIFLTLARANGWLQVPGFCIWICLGIAVCGLVYKAIFGWIMDIFKYAIKEEAELKKYCDEQEKLNV